MATDLRQLMAGFLTFSMFCMLGNMIKKDHIDPLMGPLPQVSPTVRFGELKVSKPAMLKLSEINYGPWLEQDEPVKPCWKKPTLKGRKQFDGYVFFSLTRGPEYHASEVANAVAIARQLGATLALPYIQGEKPSEKINFGDVYSVEGFLSSLSGVVRVEKNPPTELLNEKLPIIRVPNMVSEEFISSRIKPVFHTKRNLRIITNFNSNSSIEVTGSSAYECLTMFESLKLQPELQELADSLVGTLRSLSAKMHGRFIAVDLKNTSDGDGKARFSAGEIGGFLRNIGFDTSTTIYLTQSRWDEKLNAMREVFPNSFIKDAIMAGDVKARFGEMKSKGLEKYVDYYMCVQGDVFVPAFPSRFYASVVGKRIGLGKTQVFIPTGETSASAGDHISPYVARKSHFAYSCLC